MAYSIILADDSLFIRTIMRRSLEKHDFTIVSEASTGYEAVDEYIKHQPDLIILDISMPQKNGTEAAKDIIAQFPEAVIIMCSALGQRDFIDECLEIGVTNFIVKPFYPERLPLMILRTMEKVKLKNAE